MTALRVLVCGNLDDRDAVVGALERLLSEREVTTVVVLSGDSAGRLAAQWAIQRNIPWWLFPLLAVARIGPSAILAMTQPTAVVLFGDSDLLPAIDAARLKVWRPVTKPR